MKKATTILFLVGIFAVSVGISYSLFLKSGSFVQNLAPQPSPTVTKSGGVAFDPSLPKTEECPLNGAKYSKQQKQWWEKHRPLGIMIENHEDARPQSGIQFADVVYEAVAEGGITRFLTVFYCQDASQVGPVRSARTYFLNFISEYGDNPLYTHVGGANTSGPADALSQINDYDWGGYNDLNQFSIGFPVFWRDYNRLGHSTATEHTMYSTTTKLWDFAKSSRNLTNIDKKGNSWDKNFVPYTFKEDALLADRPVSQPIHVEFWSGYSKYFVDWVYDKTNNLYKRKNGGEAHIDKDTNNQLTAKNVVVLMMRESHANDGYDGNAHLLYKNIGTGKAAIFIDGKRINGTWRKDSRTARLLLFDANGSAVKFDRGVIWFEVLPLDDGILAVK